MSPRPVVSILTDFGARDPSGAICEGVILGICPEAAVIRHGVVDIAQDKADAATEVGWHIGDGTHGMIPGMSKLSACLAPDGQEIHDLPAAFANQY